MAGSIAVGVGLRLLGVYRRLSRPPSESLSFIHHHVAAAPRSLPPLIGPLYMSWRMCETFTSKSMSLKLFVDAQGATYRLKREL